MKKLTVLSVFIPFLFFIGCTMPSQRVAAQALELSIEHDTAITNEFANMSKQMAVDVQTMKVKIAVRNKDEEGAVAAIEQTANYFDMISYLELQSEKSKSLKRIAQSYIWEQAGIFDLIYDDFQATKKALYEEKSD